MRLSVAVAVSCILITGLSAAEHAAAAIRKETNIAAQGLGPALKELAKERDFQILYRTELVGQRQTPGAVGDLTLDEALQKLLNGTDLTFQYLDDNTVTVIPAAAGTQADPGTALLAPNATSSETAASKGERSFWGRFRLAQATEGNAAVNERASQASPEGTPRATQIEEVVVTAQKRKERLQDVPISISVLSSETLDKSNDRGVSDALNRVPNVISSAGSQQRFASAAYVAIRGVAPVGGASATTGYYLDSIPFGFTRFAFAPDSNAYDMERVEVLRGPQGTLYGASALNGVVRVLTRDADLEDFELKGRASTSTVKHGGESYRGDMAVNVPIVEGKLAARAVVGYLDESGWMDKSIQQDANDRQTTNGRLKLNAQPTEQFAVGLSAWVSRTDQGGSAYSSLNREQSRSALEEPSSVDYDAYNAKLSYDFDAFSVTSMTSYIDFKNISLTDYTVVFGLPDTLLNTRFEANVLAEEFVVNSTHDGAWRWSLGGMYRDAEDRLFQDRLFSSGAPHRDQYPGGPTDQKTFSESFAVFGEITRLFADGQFEVTAGLRYFEDDVSDKEISRNVVLLPGQQLINSANTFDNVSPRVVLTWHSSEQLTLYASYGEGFRSGLNQLPTFLARLPDFPPAQPDDLKNYELGVKGTLFDGRLTFDTAAFSIDWQDGQQSITTQVAPTIFLPAVVNSGSMSGPGFEFALTAEPIDRLTVGLNFGWNALEFDADVVPATGGIAFRKGGRLIGSPETTAGALVDYTFPLGGSGYSARLSGSANYISKTINAKTATATYYREPVTLIRTSIGLESPKGWVASLFCDNLSDEKGFIADQISPNWNTYGRPRTIGLQVDFRY